MARRDVGSWRAPSTFLCVLWLAVFTTADLRAQTIRGVVVENTSDTPIPGAVVRLLSPTDDILATTLSDSIGHYVIDAPEPGAFKLSATRLGYFEFSSPLLTASNPDGVYGADLAMHLDPVELEGIEVRAEQQAGLASGLRRAAGLNPKSLSHEPINRAQLLAHVERGRNLQDVLRWDSGPRIIVRQDMDGPCFLYRGRSCLPVYLDGDRLPKNITDVIPLEMLEYALIVTPTESVQYAGGAVLLYTHRWLWWLR